MYVLYFGIRKLWSIVRFKKHNRRIWLRYSLNRVLYLLIMYFYDICVSYIYCFVGGIMALQVINGAVLMCTCGTAPSSLLVPPMNGVNSTFQPAANIMDHKPFVNILPFTMCTTPSNPAVAAATSAAMGVLTPVPCVPVTSAPWISGASTVLIAHQPALNDSSTLMCNWGGSISVKYAGQVTHKIP